MAMKREWLLKGLTLALLAAPALMHAQLAKFGSVEKRQTGLEVLMRMEKQPGHITVTNDGRVIMSIHQLDSPNMRVAELKADGNLVAFPNAQWAGPPKADGTGIARVAALISDPRGYVGILDAGDPQHQPKMVVWDTKQNKLVHAPAIQVQAKSDYPFVQDVACDTVRRKGYLLAVSKDRTSGAVIVIDMPEGRPRLIPISKPGFGSPAGAVADGKRPEGWSLREQMNVPIAIDPACEWVYFGGMTRDKIFRVKAEILADPGTTAETLTANVQDYGTKANSNKMVADNLGNVYVTEEQKNSIGVFSPKSGYRTLLRDEILNWPYGMILGSDNYLYITVNKLKAAAEKGDIGRAPAEPYLLVRYKSIADKPDRQ